jgi:U3 small nucleolar RNA-associated protein 18
VPNDWRKAQGTGSDEDTGRKPVWVDSDDDRLHVSLASDPRLRKLRNTEAEDIVNGREYIKRLRRQYERLHPPPAWASVSMKGHYQSKKRTNSLGSQNGMSDEDADSDMLMDDDVLEQRPTQALSELLRSAGSLIQPASSSNQPTKHRKLRPEVLDIQRTKDITNKGPSSVDSLQFHPYYPLILSSGPSSTISIHHISPHPPNPNPLLTSLHVKSTPLHTTAFLPPINPDTFSDAILSDSTTIYLSSRRRYFHTWSLATGSITKIARPFTTTPHLRNAQRTTESFHLSPCGRYIGFVGSARKGGGYVNILSTTTTQWLCTCRIDSRGGVADFAWWQDGNGLVVAGKNGECSEYSVQERRVVLRWKDEGAVGTTVIALGGNTGSPSSSDRLGGDRYVAVGSSSGIVNIYDRSDHLTTHESQQPSAFSTPNPLRSLTHLTTPTSHLTFGTDGQLLVMASRWKKDALRLVHLPSCTVYRNWPTDKTPLGRVSSVALSPDGGMLAVGNEQGAVRLWEIRG